MTARLNSANGPPRPVVSVSPHDIVDGQSAAMLDDRTAALRNVLRDAAAVTAEAQQALSQLQDSRSRVDEASAHMQDQLRVGARLLQASQSQSSRIAADIQGLDERHRSAIALGNSLQEQLAQFESSADSIVRKLAASLSEILNAAIAGFEESLSRRVEMSSAVDERILRASQRLDALCAAVDVVIDVGNLRHAGAQAPLRRELERRDESAPLEIAAGKNRGVASGEALPQLRLQSWAGGG